MLICPICKTEYQDGDEFCKNEGAKLVRSGSVDKPKDIPKDPDTSATDESVRRELRQLRADLTQRDARITELEEQLALAKRELQKLRDAAVAVDRPVIKGKDKPTAQPRSKKSGPKRDESSLVKEDDTDLVPPPEGAHGWLVCVAGPLAGKRFAITADGLKIGRAKKFSDEGGISVADNRVSNPHAWIGLEKDKVVVKDEGSTNGTYLNDPESERITKAVLEFGSSVILADGAAEFVYRK